MVYVDRLDEALGCFLMEQTTPDLFASSEESIHFYEIPVSAHKRFANRFDENCSESRIRPRAPIFAASTGSPRTFIKAAANAGLSPGAIKYPVTPSSMISANPPTLVAMTGRAAAMASAALSPNPSNWDGTATTSIARLRGPAPPLVSALLPRLYVPYPRELSPEPRTSHDPGHHRRLAG